MRAFLPIAFLAACAAEPTSAPTPATTPEACGDTALPIVGGGCRPVGVPNDGCGEGFEHTDRDTCRAILPPAPCPDGTIATPADRTCRSIGTCGGSIPPGALRVDRASTAPDPDGSEAKPYPTIQAALTAASDGARIVVAAGSYPEALKIGKRVTLQGTCASKVEIAGATGAFASIEITAAGVVLSDVAVSGTGFGVVVTNARDVMLERLRVHDTRVGGVYIANGGPGASATLRESVIERATGAGATAGSGELVIERSLIRDTRADTRKDWGYGVRSERFGPVDKPSEVRGRVTMRRSWIDHNKTGGALAQGSDLTLEGSAITEVGARPKDGAGGEGVIGLSFHGAPMVQVAQSYIARSRTAGIAVYGGELSIDRTTIEEILENDSGMLGVGVLARPSGPDVSPPLSAKLTMSASAIDNVRYVGVLILGAEATLSSTSIRDVAARSSDAAFGDGIGLAGFPGNGGAILETRLTATDVLVMRAARAGITVGGASLSLERSRLSCNTVDLDVEPFIARDVGQPFKLEDRGGNACGCASLAACAARTDGLEPASAP